MKEPRNSDVKMLPKEQDEMAKTSDASFGLVKKKFLDKAFGYLDITSALFFNFLLMLTVWFFRMLLIKVMGDPKDIEDVVVFYVVRVAQVSTIVAITFCIIKDLMKYISTNKKGIF